MNRMTHPIYLFLVLLCTVVLAEDTLSVYHKRGGDYLKRGDIIDIPHAPKYVPLEHGHGDLGPGLYQVKIKHEKTGVITLSSLPSCHLKASGFADEFRIHLDEKDEIYHVDYYATTGECQPVTTVQPTEEFKSQVKLIKAIHGVKPVLGQFNGKQPKPKPTAQRTETSEKEQEEEEEDKTFFQKYWYLILAGAFMLMSNIGAPPEPATR